MGKLDGRKFFVRHLPSDDARRSKGQIFQIQLVDRYGLAVAYVFLADDETALIDGEKIPGDVVRAARELKPGASMFVDSCGIEVLPKDLAD